jgi:hypothetical protein
MQKNKAKKMAESENMQWFKNSIMASPRSCAKMKAIVNYYLHKRILKAKHPDGHQLREAENLLHLISVAEETFKNSKIVNGKELFEYSADTEKYRPIDDKPKWQEKRLIVSAIGGSAVGGQKIKGFPPGRR